MKLLIVKIMIAVSVTLGVMSCDNRGDMENDRGEGYTPAASEGDKTNADDINGKGVRDSASVSAIDTTYNSTSDTIYKRR